MHRSAGLILGSLALLLAGGVCLTAGLFERRMAIAQEDTVVFEFAGPLSDYAELEPQAARIPLIGGPALDDIRRRRAAIHYWQGDYGDLVEVARANAESAEPSAVDPRLQVLAANALFRTAQRGPQDRATLLRNLDAAIRAYADALRAGGASQDVAYNYELAIRLRDAVNAGKVKSLAPPKPDDTDTDPNMHGDPGEPPKELKVEQFQIRVPMDPREVKQSQDQAAGTGQARRKRG